MIVNDDYTLLLFFFLPLRKAANTEFSNINRLGEHDGI
jgi:hypothetical protein